MSQLNYKTKDKQELFKPCSKIRGSAIFNENNSHINVVKPSQNRPMPQNPQITK